MSVQATGAEPASLEDAVKAAYVYKFAPFVTWPAPVAPGAPFVICTLGSDRVSALLPQVAEGQRVDDHPIHVRQVAENEPADGCRILYVADEMQAAGDLDGVRGKPILTITSEDGPAGVIHLSTAARHVVFDIDAKLAAQDGLQISSKLLGLARKVNRASGAPP